MNNRYFSVRVLSSIILGIASLVYFSKPNDAYADAFAVACPNGNSPRQTTTIQGVLFRPFNQEIRTFGRARKIFPLTKVRSTKAVQCALADLNGDGTPEIITVPGRGLGPTVRVYDGKTFRKLSGSLGSFAAFESSYRGGVFVAAGDVNGDGTPDIVAGQGSGGSRVRVFDGQNGNQINDFFAYDTPFNGGVRVASMDINGDGRAEIVTGPGPGTDTAVKVFNGQTGDLFQSFIAFEGFRGGVFVAVGEINADGRPDIIVGPGSGTANLPVKVFNEFSTGLITSFFPYGETFKGGVRVGAADLDNDGRAEIITGPATRGSSKVRVFDGVDQSPLNSFNAFPGPYNGGVNVGVFVG